MNDGDWLKHIRGAMLIQFKLRVKKLQELCFWDEEKDQEVGLAHPHDIFCEAIYHYYTTSSVTILPPAWTPYISSTHSKPLLICVLVEVWRQTIQRRETIDKKPEAWPLPVGAIYLKLWGFLTYKGG